MYCYFYLIFFIALLSYRPTGCPMDLLFIIFHVDNFGTRVERVVTMSSSKLTFTIVFYLWTIEEKIDYGAFHSELRTASIYSNREEEKISGILLYTEYVLNCYWELTLILYLSTGTWLLKTFLIIDCISLLERA